MSNQILPQNRYVFSCNIFGTMVAKSSAEKVAEVNRYPTLSSFEAAASRYNLILKSTTDWLISIAYFAKESSCILLNKRSKVDFNILPQH